MASPEASAAAGDVAAQTAAVEVEPIRLPSHEDMKMQDTYNNCVVRSVLSGVMGNNLNSKSSFTRLLVLLSFATALTTGKL
jgi:import inner membrane translocase subunit TIM22